MEESSLAETLNEYEAANLEDEITEDNNDNCNDIINNDHYDNNGDDDQQESPENMDFDQNQDPVEMDFEKDELVEDEKVEEHVNEEAEPGNNSIIIILRTNTLCY